MNARLITGLALLTVSVGCLLDAASAHADQYLVGAYLFSADAAGATAATSYQYDTNTAEGASPLNLNGAGKSIAFALPNGSTAFSFDQSLNTPLSIEGPVGDLGLFFSTSNTPYNTLGARTPDLLVARRADGSAAFFTPAAGTTINDYHYEFGTPGNPANGLTTFTLGSSTITVTDYSVADKPSGSFTLLVADAPATPEPGSVALLAGLSISGGMLLKRRKKSSK